MHRSRARLIFACLLGLALRSGSPLEPATAADSITVGVITALSGEYAAYGQTGQNALSMGLEKLSRQIRARIKVVYEDDRGEPKNTVAAFHKLLATHNIDVFVTAASGTSKAVAPLAEQKGVVLIAIASDPEIVANRRWVFNFWVTPEEEAKVALREAVRRGYKRIARITTVQEGFLSGKRMWDEYSSGHDLKVILDEEYPGEIKDFKPFLTKARALPKLDAVLVLMMPGQVGIFAKQAREMGLRQPLFNLESFEDPNEVATSKGALIGQWYVNADDADTGFIQEYLKRFPGSSSWTAANMHDVALLLGAALESGSSREHICQFLAGLKDFQGALGTYSASSDNRFTLAAAVKIVTAEGFKRLDLD